MIVLYSSHNFPNDKLRDTQPNIYHAYYLYLIIPKSNNYRNTILKTCCSLSVIYSYPMNIKQFKRLRDELNLVQMVMMEIDNGYCWV